MTRSLLAWLAFTAGVIFITGDIVRLEITGLFLMGVVFLVLWFWLIGGFTREFWIAQIPADEDRIKKVDPIDWALGPTADEQRAKWRAASAHFDPAP